ncbi:hypothetical protein ALO_05920 [Acetonema longum DSM 6540]|uniref:Uncharacterized protein n=1 Tax=Acetonema longum DSM 6540 TaxID=1009370 RepID=F7NGJ6_9FIRM|nr:hypothetical protein ALO_05920 [Acetonema longum DSM 6540]
MLLLRARAVQKAPLFGFMLIVYFVLIPEKGLLSSSFHDAAHLSSVVVPCKRTVCALVLVAPSIWTFLNGPCFEAADEFDNRLLPEKEDVL